MTVSSRLVELGIELPAVVPPVAAYIPATVHGDLVYTSGQLPMVEGATARVSSPPTTRRRSPGSRRSTRSPPRPPPRAVSTAWPAWSR